MIDQIKEFEQTYPVIAEEFKKIQSEQYELFAKKMLSYGLSNIGVGTENVSSNEQKYLSLAGCWYRMNDKIQRLKQLVLLNKQDQVGEAISDTFQDLSVYGIIAQIVQRKKWAK